MREYNLIRKAINKFDLNLDGLTVLTEAASGHFVWTAIIAGLAGAEVLAYSKDSIYDSFSNIKENTFRHAIKLGIERKLTIIDNLDPTSIKQADIITNTGFLRPLNSEKLKHTKKRVVIPLMWETWEFREEDLDLNFCIKNNIPVLGTDESDERLQTIKYLGPLAKKLLLNNNIELCLSNILILGKGTFAETIYKSLNTEFSTCRLVWENRQFKQVDLEAVDAIIVADHGTDFLYIGNNDALVSITDIKKNNPWVKLIHISGNIDVDLINKFNFSLSPKSATGKPYKMSVTTAYVGPKPIIDLHTAGLKVGGEMYKARIKYSSLEGIKKEALRNRLCQDFTKSQLINIVN